MVASGGGPNASEVNGFVFKADIKKYFQSVDHGVLMGILAKRIKDKDVLWLIRKILDNHDAGTPGRGMPLGNWTSQFFANVYLNELDQYVKHNLRIKCYIRYVDDFVILHRSKDVLRGYKGEIERFLKGLKLDLHPQKCKIIPLSKGVDFLGFRIFYHHKLLRRKNIWKFKRKIGKEMISYGQGLSSAWQVLDSFNGWIAYAMHANTFQLRARMRSELQRRLLTKSHQTFK